MSDRRDYFARAESWSDDVRTSAARSRRLAWIVAGTAIGVAALEAVALAMLAPLKTVQPITLLVDKQTGYVQALDPLTPRRIGADEALTNSLLAQYVQAREEYDRATVAVNYRRVGLWSAGRARDNYLAQMPATNPESPLRRYPAGTRLNARVKSVSRLSRGVALVRFDTQLITRDGQPTPPQPWISVVRFRYVDAPMRLEDRLVNPLGFQVIGYRRDAEAPPPPPAVTLASPAAPPARVMTSTVVDMPAQASPTGISRLLTPDRTYRGPLASPVTVPPQPQHLPRTGAADRREIPLNNLPMGSPLSPAGAPVALAGGAPR